MQPVEIAAGLKRELDIQSVIVDRDRVLTANQFNIRVSPEDAERLDQYSGTLQSELESVVARYADDQGYQLLGPAVIAINADDTLTRGILQIDAAKPKQSCRLGTHTRNSGQTLPASSGHHSGWPRK